MNGSQTWLHISITWGVLKNTNYQSLGPSLREFYYAGICPVLGDIYGFQVILMWCQIAIHCSRLSLNCVQSLLLSLILVLSVQINFCNTNNNSSIFEGARNDGFLELFFFEVSKFSLFGVSPYCKMDPILHSYKEILVSINNSLSRVSL